MDDRQRVAADDGMQRPAHAGIGQIGRAAGKDDFVGRLHMGVGADDGGDLPLQAAAKGDLFAGRLGMEIDKDDLVFP